MCLILLACREDPRYPLVVAANRDEFRERPTEPAALWDDHPEILAGRDLRAGGTWMGVSAGGRFAAITNFRRIVPPRENAPSRGTLVTSFLAGDRDAAEYLRDVSRRGSEYEGFTLIASAEGATWWYSNAAGDPRPIEPGIHGLSNALLDSPWPKVERGRRAMAAILADGGSLVEPLFAILADRTRAADGDLPETGVGRARERDLSPMFIVGRDYGTRCSTILLMREDGSFEYHERGYDGRGRATGTRSYRMNSRREAMAR